MIVSKAELYLSNSSIKVKEMDNSNCNHHRRDAARYQGRRRTNPLAKAEEHPQIEVEISFQRSTTTFRSLR
jgi:hypothetical protein